VFEVRSASQSLGDLREKMEAYLANGARLSVLIDPYRQARWKSTAPAPRWSDTKGLSGCPLDPELPGFILELEPIFE
jgi:Uma2 family endonuclease